MRKTADSMSVRSVGSSADLLAFRFSRTDLIFVFLAGTIAFCESWFSSAASGVLDAVLSTSFVIEVYLCFRLLLPMALFIRVGDVFRCRYGFGLACAAGALSVLDHGPVRSLILAPEFCLLQLVVAGWAVLGAMMFVRMCSRALLSAVYLAIGGLIATGPVGLVTLLLVWLVHLSVRVRLLGDAPVAPAVEHIEDDRYSEILVVVRCCTCLRNSRILCALSLMGGAAVALIVRTRVFFDSDGAAAFDSLLCSYRALGPLLMKVDFMAPLMVTGALIFVALCFSRRATDILEPLRGGHMLLFGIVMVVSLIWSTGVIWKLDPFSAMKPICIIPEIFSAAALVVSVSVFIVELGCRNHLVIPNGIDEDLYRAPSRLARNLRVFGLAMAILVIVEMVPRFLRA